MTNIHGRVGTHRNENKRARAQRKRARRSEARREQLLNLRKPKRTLRPLRKSK